MGGTLNFLQGGFVKSRTLALDLRVGEEEDSLLTLGRAKGHKQPVRSAGQQSLRYSPPESWAKAD